MKDNYTKSSRSTVIFKLTPETVKYIDRDTRH